MKKLLFLVAVFLVSTGAYAQIESHVKWAYAAKKISPTEAVVLIRATIDDDWHIYSVNQKDGGPVKTSFTFTPSKEYSLLGKPAEPTPVTKFEKAFGIDVSYFEKTVTFQQKIKLKSAKETTITGKLEYMTCNDKKCLPPDDIDFSVTIK